MSAKANLFEIDGMKPQLGARVFVAPTATLIGDVVLGDDVSIWFGAVLRGDMGAIRVGARSNIQDLSMVHMTSDLSITEIGDDVTVGHSVVLHGCRVENRCLIGMGSILLDNAVVGEGSLVAAGSVVPPRMVVPPRSLVRGAPAKVIREVNEQEARMGVDGAQAYCDLRLRYLTAGIRGAS